MTAVPPPLRNPTAALAKLLPNATTRSFEGRGHGAPADDVAPALEAFFGA